ncbi:MAG: hypothetical protein LHW52_05450 [Candidatus Cloacimonetes bacterium]|jgi:hypothetical protein|nr:hypothetical protein [Candidatus Cloacimonadota bacterium]
MKQDKRSLAAISAVMALLCAEDTTVAYQKPLAGNPSHPWPAYARSQTMQYRDITQRRIIKRSR